MKIIISKKKKKKTVKGWLGRRATSRHRGVQPTIQPWNWTGAGRYAVKLDRTEQDKVKKHVKKAYHNIKTPRGMMGYEKSFDVGDRVRIKLNQKKEEKKDRSRSY